MSKTKQRKVSHYMQGVVDSLADNPKRKVPRRFGVYYFRGFENMRRNEVRGGRGFWMMNIRNFFNM